MFLFSSSHDHGFDYGLLKDSEERLRQMFENPQVVCKLDDKEYIDLVYAISYKAYDCILDVSKSG